MKLATRHVVNRAATALRIAAWNLIRSQSALGAKFRRLRTRLGAPKAITAMAHHLARLLDRAGSAKPTLTKANSTTKPNTVSTTSDGCKNRLPPSTYNSFQHKHLPHEFLESQRRFRKTVLRKQKLNEHVYSPEIRFLGTGIHLVIFH